MQPKAGMSDMGVGQVVTSGTLQGCCHVCGSGMLANNAGHDGSMGDAYEGCTMAGCRRRKEIKLAGPCSHCDHLMCYLDNGAKGSFRSLPVPTGHLATDCPLAKGKCYSDHPVGSGVQAGAYTALKVFLTNLSRRTEAEFANIVRDNKERDLNNRVPEEQQAQEVEWASGGSGPSKVRVQGW